MAQTYDYSQTQNEGTGYAREWQSWVQQQPWFQQRLQQLQHELAAAPGQTGRINPSDPVLNHFRLDVGEMSKKLGRVPPQDFSLDRSGALTHDDFLTRNPWMYAVLMGGMAAGPLVGAATSAASGGGAAVSGAGATAGGTAAGIGANASPYVLGAAPSGISAGTATGLGAAAGGTAASFGADGTPIFHGGVTAQAPADIAGLSGSGMGGAGLGYLASKATADPAGTLPPGQQGKDITGNAPGTMSKFLQAVKAHPELSSRLAALGIGSGLSLAGKPGDDPNDPKKSAGGGANYPPELQQLLKMTLQRMSSQQPLFNAVNAQALGGLPRQS